MPRSKTHRTNTELTAKEISALLEASQISEEEIQLWHADFLAHCPSGLFDKTSFMEYYEKLHPRSRQIETLPQIFDMIDVNRDGTIDFNEFLAVIVLTNRLKDLGSRLSFFFDMWDQSGDGLIDQKELTNTIEGLYDRAGITDRKDDRSPKKRAKEIIAQLDVSGDRKLSKEEFVNGCKNDPVLRQFFAPNL